jgi:hypothetical protein
VADKALAIAALDAAFTYHMRSLFGVACRHIEQRDEAGARKEFRKAFAIAQTAHSEMLALVNEALP